MSEKHINDFIESQQQVVDSAPEKLLEGARITLSETLEPPPPVIQVDNMTAYPVTIFTEGNVSVIQGKAKARKSFAVAMLAAASVSDSWVYRKFNCVPRKYVIYFDTEQSSFYVQQAMSRIYNISEGDGFDKRFFSYCLRPFNPQERLSMIEWVFDNFKNIGFVIIDGIRDLINDINSPDEATMITSKLLKWSERSGAHILTVLHENKGDGKARGHIGTELVNKAETVLKVEKSEQNKMYSKISCEMVRGLDFEPIYFTIKENIPVIESEPPSELISEFE